MVGRRKSITLSTVNIVSFGAVLVLNTLATTLPLGGMTTGALSDLYPNLFVPAGITFTIWGVIYLLLVIFVIYSLVRSIKGTTGVSFVGRVLPLFLVTCLANCGWILAWQYRVVLLSLALMFILLGALIMIYVTLSVGKGETPAIERYLLHLPISVYFGWITIASIANLTAVLVAYRLPGFGLADQPWAILMIAIGLAAALLMAFKRGDIFYALVVDWAFLGIYLKRSAGVSVPASGVMIASLVGVGAVSAGIIVQLVRRKVYS